MTPDFWTLVHVMHKHRVVFKKWSLWPGWCGAPWETGVSHRRSQSVRACRRSFHRDTGTRRRTLGVPIKSHPRQQSRSSPTIPCAATPRTHASELSLSHALSHTHTLAADRPQTPSGWRWWMLCITWLVIWTLAKQLGPTPPGGLSSARWCPSLPHRWFPHHYLTWWKKWGLGEEGGGAFRDVKISHLMR